MFISGLRLELQKWYAINKVMIKLMLTEMTDIWVVSKMFYSERFKDSLDKVRMRTALVKVLRYFSKIAKGFRISNPKFELILLIDDIKQ